MLAGRVKMGSILGVALPNGLVLHLSGKNIDLPNLANVSSWQDVSGYGNHMGTANFGTNPKYNSTNKSVIFNGINNVLALADSTKLALAESSIFVVAKTSNAGSSFRGIVVKQFAYGIFFSDNKLTFYDWTGGGINSVSVTSNDNTLKRYEAHLKSGTTDNKISVNGGNEKVFLYTTANQNSALVLGAGSGDGSSPQHFNGEINEILIFNHRLVVDDINVVRNYLTSEWG